MDPMKVYERYRYMYEEFKLYVCSDESLIEDWRPGARNELIVYMTNGDIISFDNVSKTFSYIREYEENEFGGYDLNNEEYKRAFSNKLRHLMNVAKMNQKELSEATGINVSTISHYMVGRNLPDCYNLKILSRALGCSIGELLEFERRGDRL